jgi:hypothetical protein
MIYTRSQFHQHITSSFCAKKVQTLNLSTKKLCTKLSYEKAARIMLVKLTRGWTSKSKMSIEQSNRDIPVMYARDGQLLQRVKIFWDQFNGTV